MDRDEAIKRIKAALKRSPALATAEEILNEVYKQRSKQLVHE